MTPSGQSGARTPALRTGDGGAEAMDEPGELRNNRQWRMAVWALRFGYLALALTIVGIIVMSSGSTPWVLAVGVIIWLIAAAVTLIGVFGARSELPEPRPGFWPMRWMLLHDTGSCPELRLGLHGRFRREPVTCRSRLRASRHRSDRILAATASVRARCFHALHRRPDLLRRQGRTSAGTTSGARRRSRTQRFTP